jgi:hypothetical protein
MNQIKKNMIKVFTDFKNAYYSVIIERLLLKLHPILNHRFLAIIKSLFLNGGLCIKVNGKRTSFINRTNGLLQGSVLSPILFNFYINDLCFELNRTGRLFRSVFYADDLVVIGNNIQEMNDKMFYLNNWCKINGITVNLQKSGAIGSNQVKFNKEIIPETYVYKYLGVWFNDDGIIIEDTFRVISEKADGIIKFTSIISIFLSQQEKIYIFKSYILPYFNMYMPLFFFKLHRSAGSISSYSGEIKNLNKKLVSWIYGTNSRNYNILFSMAGLLNVTDLMHYISIMFNYSFMSIKVSSIIIPSSLNQTPKYLYT